jgi:hypothetical protein
MAGVLSACSKLEDLALQAYDDSRPEGGQRVSNIVDIDVLASGTQLLSLDMSHCRSVSDLAPLGAMVNLHDLSIGYCRAVSDLAPLTALVNLKSLDVRGCSVSDLAPIEAMTNLQDLQSDVLFSDSEGGDEFSEDDDSSEEDDGVRFVFDVGIRRGPSEYAPRPHQIPLTMT